MTRRRTPRCEHGMAPGLCVLPACPHWDGREPEPAGSEQGRRRDLERARVTDPRETFAAFVTAVRGRLELGADAYADRPAAERPLPELASEMAQELEDLAGWAACLWPRVVALRAALEGIEATPPALAASSEPRGTVTAGGPR